jgi:hypothetical protein
MNSHAATAQLAPVDADLAVREDLVALEGAHARITGWHALEGLPLGVLRGLAPGTDVTVSIDQVVEEASDLAVADRVAWILAGRTGIQHVVLASTSGYLVATVSPELDWAAAMRLEPTDWAPRVVSVATADGVLPILLPIQS